MTRRELLELHRAPPVTCLADLDPGERVWTVTPQWGEAAHRRAHGRVAVCGVELCEFYSDAGVISRYGGDLCRSGCWAPAGETEEG